MALCLRVVKESNESRFESNSVREHCFDHIPFYQKKKNIPFYLSGLSRAHFFLTTSLEIAVNISSLRPSHSKPMVFKVNDVLAWAGCNVGYRNTFFAKTSRSYNGPAVRIKGNKPNGKNMIQKNKNKTRKKLCNKEINS